MLFVFFFFKQKTAYEMRISDWSSDVCSSDLLPDLRNPVTFEMAPAPKAEKARSKAEKSEKKKQEKSAQRQVQQPVVKRDRPVVKPTEQQPSPLPFLVLDRQQLASAAIDRKSVV